MKRISILSIVAAAATFAAFAANAAIVTLTGPSQVSPGSSFILTATVSTGVGPADVPGVSVLGSILYDDAFVNTNVPGSSQNVIPGWTAGVLDCTTARCRAFNQIAPLGSTPTVPALSNFVISTTSFILDPATPLGTVLEFNWQTTPATQSLLFFGATPGMGVTVNQPIPEPATAALLCVGLVGLVAAARRTRA